MPSRIPHGKWDLPTLSRGIREMRGRADGPQEAATADRITAEHLLHRLIEETAYYRWIDRGRPVGDAWADWFAAEAQITGREPAKHQLSETYVNERMRHEVIAEAAYFRWIDRSRPIGDARADWLACEAELANVALRSTLPLILRVQAPACRPSPGRVWPP